MPQHRDNADLWLSEAASFYKGKQALITGGLGMIGSTLAHILIGWGARVSILDALLPLYGGNLFNIEDIKNDVAVTIGDIRDKTLMERAIPGQDVIFHLAAQVSYIDSMTNPFLDLDINCRGSLVLLEACKALNRDARIVFTGSRMQYGRILANPVDESHPMEPLMPYGIHKLSVEKYHLMYHQNDGLHVAVARITNPYGPRQQMKHGKYGIVNWFIKQAMTGQVIKVFGDGRQTRDYIFVEDVARALLALGAGPRADGEVFNVGSGCGVAFIDMIRQIVDIVESGKIEMVPWPADYQNVETGDFVADINKIQRLVGWRARVGLADGIRKTLDFYRTNQHHYW
jgi:UDP-glucose 4-epimerase